MAEEKVIYVSLRAQFVQQLNHVFAAILLATSGLAALQHGKHMLWGALEIGVAVALVALFVRSRAQVETALRDHLPHHIGWLEILSGLVVAVEKSSMLRERPHHPSFVVISYVPALLLIFLGLFESHFRARFFIRADDEQLSWRFARWRHGKIPWLQVADASVNPRSVNFRMKDGSERKVPTWRVLQTNAVNAWIVQRIGEHEIPAGPDRVADPSPLPLESAAE